MFSVFSGEMKSILLHAMGENSFRLALPILFSALKLTLMVPAN